MPGTQLVKFLTFFFGSLLGLWLRVRVKGWSMWPTFKPGDVLLVVKESWFRKKPAPGDIVVFRHPYRKDVLLIKRVQQVDRSGFIAVAGDNAHESTDSRSFGRIPPDLLVGRVL